MPSSGMPAVEIDNITGEDLAHAVGKGFLTSSYQQMKMIRHKGPGIDADCRALATISKAGDKIFPILRVPEYLGTFYPPRHDVV